MQTVRTGTAGPQDESRFRAIQSTSKIAYATDSFLNAVHFAVHFPRVCELRMTRLALSRRQLIAPRAKCSRTRRNVSPPQ